MIVFLGKFIAYVPTAVLAGILMTVGIGIIDFKELKINSISTTRYWF